MVQNFGQSLLYGSQHIYQSMPRMLSLWLDFGAEVVAAESSDKSEVTRAGYKTILANLNRLMSSFAERLAPYQFFVVFPQLISRICHAHPDVFAQLKV
jgi:serine/threonine-protein kinase ATR